MGQNKELAIALAEYAEQVKKLHEALKEVREYIFSEEEEQSFDDGYDDDGCGHDECSQDDTSDYRQLVDNQ
jgi:hypothetical protein